LRAGVLEGTAILLAGPAAEPASGSLGERVGETCSGLGARLASVGLLDEESRSLEEAGVDAGIDEAVERIGSIDVLVIDARALFAAAGAHTRGALLGCLEASWNATRGVVNRVLLERGAGGRIVYLAPSPLDGAHARATVAGLENLARTLSIEWSRHRVTTVTVAPGIDTSPEQVAAVVTYLASPAGAYFSGCLLDLRGPCSGA
jgi:NAD(P)-dependent dehydrogenase (short-subunit alcohol dehydrogenase family)